MSDHVDYEQLDLFELTEVVCTTAKRIAEGEVINADDKLDLAEQIYVARRRMSDREFAAWWKKTDIKYSRPWRLVLIAAGKRIAADGRPSVNPVNGGEFSIRQYADTGDGWITAKDKRRAQRVARHRRVLHAAVDLRGARADV